MASPSQFLMSMRGALLRTDRFVAIDPGTHAIKLLLLHPVADGVHVLRQKSIPVAEDGGLEPVEIREQLRLALREFGQCPVAICVPQDVAISQLIDLPPAREEEINQLIEAETRKLSGLSESAIAFDYARLKPFGKYINPFWITICREEEIQSLLTRYGLGYDDVCGITTSSSALLTAYQADDHPNNNAVLVDVGASSTNVVIVHHGNGVYAGTFPIGGDYFTTSLSDFAGSSLEDAEATKREKNFLGGFDAMPEFQIVIDEWYGELDRIIAEWFIEHEEFRDAEPLYTVVLVSSGSHLPGLFEYLSENSVRRVTRWLSTVSSGPDSLPDQFAVAYGVGLQAVGKARQTVSLLPEGLQQAWGMERSRMWMQSANLLMILVVTLGLIFATWRQQDLISEKNATLKIARSALNEANAIRRYKRETYEIFRQVRPMLARKHQTLTTLQSLSLIEQAANQEYWYVLFSDKQAYFDMPSPTPVEGAPVYTNSVVPGPGYIAEVCVPAEGDAMRVILGMMVASLKSNDLFVNVDSLAPDHRRMLVDPGVVVTNHHFAFTIDVRENPFLGRAARELTALRETEDDSEAADTRRPKASFRGRVTPEEPETEGAP